MTPQLLDWLSQSAIRDSVLEIGSYNVNGSARDVIPYLHWFGTDMREGPGVDFVCDAIYLNQHFGPIFDRVVICETLEHCRDWQEVMLNAWGCLRRNGSLILSTPGFDFPKHDYPDDFYRFSLDIWRETFYDQQILREQEFHYPHSAHAIEVLKLTPYINLNVIPLPIIC